MWSMHTCNWPVGWLDNFLINYNANIFFKYKNNLLPNSFCTMKSSVFLIIIIIENVGVRHLKLYNCKWVLKQQLKSHCKGKKPDFPKHKSNQIFCFHNESKSNRKSHQAFHRGPRAIHVNPLQCVENLHPTFDMIKAVGQPAIEHQDFLAAAFSAAAETFNKTSCQMYAANLCKYWNSKNNT